MRTSAVMAGHLRTAGTRTNAPSCPLLRITMLLSLLLLGTHRGKVVRERAEVDPDPALAQHVVDCRDGLENVHLRV